MFVIDNESDVYVINRLRTRDTRLARLLRALCDASFHCNFSFEAVHRAGKLNVLMDWASRPLLHRFSTNPAAVTGLPAECGVVCGGSVVSTQPSSSPHYHLHQQSLLGLRKQGRLDDLDGLLRWLVGLCSSMYITDSSKKTYADHQGQFISFCEAFDTDPFTASELELCLVVGYVAMRHTVTSVPSYLSALQNLYDNNRAGPLPRGPRFHRFHNGLRRLLGTADAVVRTCAITMEDLAKICDSLHPADPVDACFGAQITVAFFLALRTEDHTGGRLRWGDVYP